ncbi:MAG: SMC family ATPase [candidate division KSB1 bacterium]|nr:SMC family ATPase [candidate division KSB1 bacterium]
MILHSLRLRNFRRFRSAFIEFPENVIGLLGRNGAGKSTLLEAIAWALYGSRVARTDKQQIRSQFAGERESCEVELAFALGGETYQVVRTLSGKNAVVEAALYRNDHSTPEATSDSGVNAAVERLIGLDYRAFEISIFAKQKELAALSDLQDEPRRKIISRLINLETIDRARKQIAEEANEKRRFLEGAQAAQTDVAEMEKQLAFQQDHLNSAQALFQEQEARASALAAQHEAAKKAWEEESSRRDCHNRLLTELAGLRSRQQELARQHQQAERDRQEVLAEQPKLLALQPVRQQYEKLQHEKETLTIKQQQLIRLQGKQQLAESLLTQINAQQAEANECQQQLQALQSFVERQKAVEARAQQCQTEVVKWRAEEKRLCNELASIEAPGKDLKAKLGEVHKLGAESPCPICRRPLSEHYPNVVSHLEEEMAALRGEYLRKNEEKKRTETALREAEAAEAASRKDKEALSAEHERFRQLQVRLQHHQNRIAELQKKLQEAQHEMHVIGPVVFDEARFAQVRQELQQLETQLQELTRLETRASRLPEINRRLAETQTQQATLQQREADLQDQLKTLQFDENVYLAAKQAYDEASANYLRCQQEMGEAKAQVATAAAEVRSFKQAIAKARELEAMIARTQHEVVLLDSLQGHFKNFRAEMAGRLRPLIADRASALLRMISGGRYSLLDLDESYNIFIYDRNERYEIGRYSGGEQDIANLCLRIAISQVVAQRTGKPPLQFIALDEIFGSLDEERKNLVLSVLQQLSNYFRQIFLITHIESIKEGLPVVLQVEMVDEASEVRVI